MSVAQSLAEEGSPIGVFRLFLELNSWPSGADAKPYDLKAQANYSLSIEVTDKTGLRAFYKFVELLEAAERGGHADATKLLEQARLDCELTAAFLERQVLREGLTPSEASDSNG